MIHTRDLILPISGATAATTATAAPQAFYATPPTGRGPGLVLVQEIFGVNEHIREVAMQYAYDGFSVLALDVFWRLKPNVQLDYNDAGFAQGFDLMNALDKPLAAQDLCQAAAWLRAQPECTGRVASLGFCMGGYLSYLLGATPDAVDASVCYYGGGINTAVAAGQLPTVPMLLHFAQQDGYIPAAAVASIDAALGGVDQPVRICSHPGVDHGFNCWGRAMYHQATAARARGQTLQFLADSLA